jgi:integrase
MDRDHKGTTETAEPAAPLDSLPKRHGGARMVASQLATLPDGDHTDPATVGLQLRVQGFSRYLAAREAGTTRLPKVTRAWLFRYRHGKERVRLSLGTFPGVTLAEARAAAQRNHALLKQGIDPRRARPQRARAIEAPANTAGDSHSIETLCAEFMERFIRPRRKHPAAVLAMLERDVLRAWRGRDARTIKPREVIELLDEVVERGSPVAANHLASLLSQLFRFGIHRAIVEASPVQLLYKPGGKEKPRSRVLADDELRMFLRDPQACTRFEKLSHVMLILLLTGQRRRELSLARWTEVNLERKEWTIPPENSKNGRGHVVPLSPWAVREFEALHRERAGSKYVLPGKDGEAHEPKLLTRATARCQARFKALGIGHFTLHDLRRTCRTGLAKLKVPPHIAERVVNHAQDEMTEVYDLHTYIDEKREALEKWEAHLASLAASR